MSTTPRPRLDAPVDPFRLNPADSGEPVGLAEAPLERYDIEQEGGDIFVLQASALRVCELFKGVADATIARLDGLAVREEHQSLATLYEVGFNHFFRGSINGQPGDMVYFQGHASPGVYGRAFLEGRLTEAAFLHDFAGDLPEAKAKVLYAVQEPFHKALLTGKEPKLPYQLFKYE